MIGAICLIIITLFLPPLGVLMVSGCGADFCINLLLTILGYFPGHIHAFYVEYVYYKRRDDARNGIYDSRPAPGVYSDRVNFPRGAAPAQPGSFRSDAHAPLNGQPGPMPVYQHAGAHPDQNYGTVAPPPAAPPAYAK